MVIKNSYMKWIKKFKKFKDQKVDLIFKDKTLAGRILFFAGVNSVGHKVVTTQCSRGIFYLDSWDDIDIKIA